MHPPRIAVEIADFTKSFGRRRVLHNLNVQVAEGEVVVLMGANGAGKTTLLRCIAATVRPTSGTIRCFGVDMRDPAQRGILGFLGHDSQLYPNLTLHENLRFAARMCAATDADQRAARWLAKLGLERQAGCLPGQLSRGMRQRASLARACVHEPHILLLDEPFTNLDAEGRESLIALLQQLRQQRRTLCLATHDRSIAESLADRILKMRAGRIVHEEHRAEGCASRPRPSRAA